jgi:RNA polymerase sigma-70 factor (ECF subfamily)
MNPVANDQDIQHWITRLRHGDQQAATAIYRGYFGAVSAFVHLQVNDAGAVEEIVDDTFLAAFAGLDRFENRSSFKTWLIGIAKNKSHDWLRRAKREPALADSDDSLILDSLVDQGWPALERVAATQIRRLLRFCMQRLSLLQREVTYFVFLRK